MSEYDRISELIQKLEKQRYMVSERIHKLESIQFRLNEIDGYELTEEDWKCLLETDE